MTITTGGLIEQAKELLEAHRGDEMAALEQLAREDDCHSYEAQRLAVSLAQN